MLSINNRFELRELLNEFLVFESYPEVILAPTRADKMAILAEIANSYLLKDILAFDRVWIANYPQAEFQVITPKNYLDFVTEVVSAE